METYQAPAPAGSKLLKVVGILMIIFSAITLVVGIVGLVGLGALLAVSNGTVMGVVVWAAVLAYILAFAGAVIELVAGITAVKHWANPAKAQTCVAWGVVLLVLVALNALFGLIGGESSLLSTLIGLVLLVLYIVGANQLKQQAG